MKERLAGSVVRLAAVLMLLATVMTALLEAEPAAAG